jgi:hypothetical protein
MMFLDLFLLRVFHAPSYCSFTSNLTIFSLIIDCWIDSGIHSAFIMIIINLIIDKSRLYYKITIKYWQNVQYSQLYWNKTQLKTSTQKKSAYFTHPDFSAAKIEKKCANYARKYGIFEVNVKVQLSHYRSGQALTVLRVKVPRISRQWHIRVVR